MHSVVHDPKGKAGAVGPARQGVTASGTCYGLRKSYKRCNNRQRSSPTSPSCIPSQAASEGASGYVQLSSGPADPDDAKTSPKLDAGHASRHGQPNSWHAISAASAPWQGSVFFPGLVNHPTHSATTPDSTPAPTTCTIWH
ncbi:hypothetical protein HaLaN_05018 [Haematococcus lacustris]|uniref:Uncharacterized protein n=1 Tax=Haematococcus lacustris TaxID=44745 RepID=A0A699YSA5_HAELA|nr:hypothetical protein HaLaN_05018 [Haematococcus lacustris]